MEWQFIIALVIAVPVILLPALFIWYVVVGRMLQNYTRKANTAGDASAVTVVTHKRTPLYISE